MLRNNRMPGLIFAFPRFNEDVLRIRRCSVCPEMSNKIALVSLDFAGTGSMCGGQQKELAAMDAQLVETTGVSREGPRSGTRHGATSVRGNNAAECGEPDQPDQSTKLRVFF